MAAIAALSRLMKPGEASSAAKESPSSRSARAALCMIAIGAPRAAHSAYGKPEWRIDGVEVEGRHVVHNIRSSVERGGGDFSFHRIDRNEGFGQRRPDGPDRRRDARNLIRRRYGGGAGTGAFAAHINQRRASFGHGGRLVSRGGGGIVSPS